MLKRITQSVVLMIPIGIVYFLLEVGFKLINGGLIHPSMILVGAIAGVSIGLLNQFKFFYKRKVILQCDIGTIITLGIEYIAGLIINVWLGLAVWDYSGLWGNLHGQICVQFAIAWYFIMPFAIWLEDWLRKQLSKVFPTLFDNAYDYSLTSIYKEFITQLLNPFRKLFSFIRNTRR